MTIKDFLFGKSKAAARLAGAPEPVALKRMSDPEPWFLGMFIVGVCQLEELSPTQEQFSQITAPFPVSVHRHIRAWIKVYLAWVFYLLIGEEHGTPFRDEALSSVVEASEKKIVTSEGFDVIVAGITYWFAIFDQLLANPVTLDGGQVVPVQVLIADAFLSRDPDGPIFIAGTARDPRALIAEALIECTQSLRTRFEFAVKVGAPAEGM